MLGQSAGLAMKKTIRAFKDEAKELDDDGRQRYNAFKAIIDQLVCTSVFWFKSITNRDRFSGDDGFRISRFEATDRLCGRSKRVRIESIRTLASDPLIST